MAEIYELWHPISKAPKECVPIRICNKDVYLIAYWDKNFKSITGIIGCWVGIYEEITWSEGEFGPTKWQPLLPIQRIKAYLQIAHNINGYLKDFT